MRKMYKNKFVRNKLMFDCFLAKRFADADFQYLKYDTSVSKSSQTNGIKLIDFVYFSTWNRPNVRCGIVHRIHYSYFDPNKSSELVTQKSAFQSRKFFGEKLDCLRKSDLDDGYKINDWGDPEAAKLVIHITSDFYETIGKYDSVLVFFLAKWCGHCRKLKRPYSEAALMLRKADLPGTFAVFDIMSDPDVADKENIVGVPVLKYFRKGKFISLYSGKRTAEDLYNFMKNPPKDPVHIPKIEI